MATQPKQRVRASAAHEMRPAPHGGISAPSQGTRLGTSKVFQKRLPGINLAVKGKAF